MDGKPHFPAHQQVLIVDDSKPVRRWLRKTLSPRFLTFETASASSALQLAQQYAFDLILMDYSLPNCTGLELCRRLRQCPGLEEVPIIMITGTPNETLISDAFQAGFNDFIRKPIRPVELFARVELAIRYKKARDRIDELIEELKIRSERDPLTGLYNRHALCEHASREFSKACRYRDNVAILMMDVDNFKQVNDLYGHLVGDDILSQLANLLRGHLRSYDIIARYGGDEFVVLLPSTDETQALAVGRKILEACRSHRFNTLAGAIPVRLSMGVGAVPSQMGDDEEFHKLLNMGDQALYQAKREGRDRVCVMLARETVP